METDKRPQIRLASFTAERMAQVEDIDKEDEVSPFNTWRVLLASANLKLPNFRMTPSS